MFTIYIKATKITFLLRPLAFDRLINLALLIFKTDNSENAT